MATSGTIGSTVITCGEIFDHAFRRCKVVPELTTNQDLATAKKLLWMILNMLNGQGVALWVIDTQLVGLTYGQAKIPMAVGDKDLLNSNLREIQLIPGVPTTLGSFGGIGNVYDQNLTTSFTASVNSNVDIVFTTQPSALTQYGFLPAASGTWSYTLQWSPDGSTWVTYNTITNQVVTAGVWQWFDVDAVPQAFAARIQATNNTTLSLFEIVCGNTPSDIPMSPMDRDTYTQLPNKEFPGRPVQYWWDRRMTYPIMHIWPTPDVSYPLTFLLVNYVSRQLQDVGSMSQQVELPDRWYLPVISELARNLAREIKEVDASLLPDLDKEADRLMLAGWNSESSGGPARFVPNISVYTR